jgi:transposase InsO family protein
MNIVTRTPHDLKTKVKACETYINTKCSVRHIMRVYHVSKASLMRWLKKYDGTPESLANKSHRPHKPHPRSHTEQEITTIKNYIRRNPDIGLNELYSKLRLDAAYSRHYTSLYRVLIRLGHYGERVKKKTKYVPKPYDTPQKVGEKWQIDVKYVPSDCKSGTKLHDKNFYQYTVVDEATRERFLFAYDEKTALNSKDFLKRAIVYYGYIPRILQSDNGVEFTNIKDTKLIHPLDQLCNELGIIHKTIRARTPRHNGKVERSHRNDNERFYRTLKFYSLDDLRKQMKAYLLRSNAILISTLNWKNPNQKRKELEEQGLIGYLR